MTEEQSYHIDAKIDRVRVELEAKIDSIQKNLNVKIEGLPDALVKRLADRYVTKNQWWNAFAAVGLLALGGMAEKIWTAIITAASH